MEMPRQKNSEASLLPVQKGRSQDENSEAVLLYMSSRNSANGMLLQKRDAGQEVSSSVIAK
jgi:hypothetical protein